MPLRPTDGPLHASATIPFRFFDFSVSISSFASSASSASQYTATSSWTIPGIGSLSAKGIRAVGKWQLRGLEWIIIRRKLASFRRIFPHTNNGVNDNLEDAYDAVLELTRPALYSERIRKEALGFILPQIASQNVACLVKALVKWPPFEVQMFITEVMTCLPSEWLNLTDLSPSRQGMHADLWRLSYIAFTKKDCIMAPIVNFIGKLAQANSSCCQAIVEAGFLDVLMELCLRHFYLPHAHEPISLRPDDPAVLENACRSVQKVLAADHSSYVLLLQHTLIREGFQSPRLDGTTLYQDTTYTHLRVDFIEAEFACLQAIFPHTDDATIVGLENAYHDILELTRPSLYSNQIRKQALALLLPQIATHNTAHLVKSLMKWPPYEVQLFVTEVMACLPLEWLTLTELESPRHEMHEELWCTAYLPFLDHGRIILPFVTFIGELAQAGPIICQAIVRAGFDALLAELHKQKFTLPCLTVPMSSRHDLPHNLRDVCNSVVDIFATDPIVSTVYRNHPLHAFLRTAQSGTDYLSQRRATWGTLKHETGISSTRLEGIHVAMDFLSNSSNHMHAISAVVDIFEFVSSNSSESEASKKALEIFSQWMEQYPKEVSGAIRTILESNYDGATEFVSSIFCQLFDRSGVAMGYQMVSQNANLLTCFATVATGNPICSQILMDAGLQSALLRNHSRDGSRSISFGHSRSNIPRADAIRLSIRADSVTTEDTEYSYNDILLVARSTQYTEQLQKEALAIVLRQIASEDTALLIQSLTECPPLEVQLFVTELLSCLPDQNLRLTILKLPRRSSHARLWRKAYLPACTNKHGVLAPLIVFIGQLAQASPSSSQAVVKAGFLDVLMDLYLRDFHIPHCQEDSEHLRNICTSIVHGFAADCIMSAMYREHPLQILWPMVQSRTPYQGLGRADWGVLQQDPRFVVMRLEGLRDTVFHYSGLLAEKKHAYSDLVDLFEFASSDTIDPGTADEALDVLIFLMRRYLREMPNELRTFFESNYNEAIERVSRLISRVLRSSSDSFDYRAMQLMTSFIAIVDGSPVSKQILVGAGLQSLIIATLPDDLRDCPIFSDPLPLDKPRAEATIRRCELTSSSTAHSRHAATTLRAYVDVS